MPRDHVRGSGCMSAEEEEAEEDELHSPTDASEDSVDVRVRPISPPPPPLRSTSSKRKGSEPRRCAKRRTLSPLTTSPPPFRPWSFASVPPRHATLPPPPQAEPLALVKNARESSAPPTPPLPPPPPPPPPQRNYKNMSRERRMEANARERTRVHTISAAFDTLRRSVPAYSHNQKLSKLSVLRIACSYILTLSRLAGLDYSAGGVAPSLAECVQNVTRTIQTEGRLRRRREDVPN